jgi:hypothetical protein
MIVAARTTPGKNDFTVRLNGTFGGDCRLDEIRMAGSRHKGIDPTEMCCRYRCLPTKSRRHSRVQFAYVPTDLAAAERHIVVVD